MSEYRADIDGLRAIAVVSVVLFHAGVAGFDGGFVGVDVFFVVSGFLITRLLTEDLARDGPWIARFYERRARRILPALFLVIAVSMAVGYFMLMPIPYIDFARSAFAATVFGANIWFAHVSGDYFGPAAEFMPLLHTWSLGVEEQFYIFFPLILWAASRWGRSGSVIAVVVLTVLSFVISTATVHSRPEAAFYLAPYRAWELGMGALLAFSGRRHISTAWLRELVAMAGIGSILFSVFLYDRETTFPGAAALLPCAGTAAVIAAGIGGPSLTSRVLSWRPLVFLGLVSYSLYLWHWPILAFLRLRFNEIDLPPNVIVTALALSLGLAVVSWRYVELPFRRRPPEGFASGAVFRLSGGSILLLLLAASLVRESEGIPSRVPQDVRVAYEASRDINPARARCFNKPPSRHLCRFPTDERHGAEPEILLWGDSHADAIMPGISEAADQLGMRGVFVGKQACAPLRGIERADERVGLDCASFNEQVLEYLREHREISIVILAARWALAAEGERARGEIGDPVRLVTVESDEGKARRREGNFQLFRSGLSATVDAIRSMRRQVVLIGNIPEIGWDVPSHSIAHARWGDPLPLAPTIDEVMNRQGRADRVLARLADTAGVHYQPIAPELCAPVCRTNVDERPVYFDDDHLNRFGATRLIAPLVVETLRSLSDENAGST